MTTTPHDAFAKTTFQRPELAAEEILHALGPKLAQRIDPRSLTQLPGSFIAEDLRGRATDVLYAAKMDGHQVLIYVLLEHQSTDDRWMPLRVLQYMVEIWAHFRRQDPKARSLPIILPVVLHHGDTPWRWSTHFEALLDLPAEGLEDLLAHVPRFCFALDDLAAQSEADLRARPASAHLRLVLLALQYARTAPSLEELLVRLLDLLRELSTTPEGRAALRELFGYLVQVRGAEECARLVKVAAQIPPRDQENGMQTIAEMWLEQGALRGQNKVLLRLLRTRFGELPAAVVARVTSADEPHLERWTDRVLFAGSLDEVFAPE